MPQELHVLRCVDCGTFQVHIVKKVPKWTCKICQKKQSVLQVFAQGSGKDCRLHVQRLNKQRLQQEAFPTAVIANEDDLDTNDDLDPRSESEGEAIGFNTERVGSKWDKYIDKMEESAEEEQDLDEGFDFKEARLARKRKCEQRSAISVSAKKPAQLRIEAEDETVDELSERSPDVVKPKKDLVGEQRSKQMQGAKEVEATSKWAKYVDPPEEEDSSAEETLEAEFGDVEEHEEDLDELLKF